MEVKGRATTLWLSRYFQRDCGPQRTRMEQRKRTKRKEQQRNHSANPLILFVPLIFLLKKLSDLQQLQGQEGSLE